jgi:hypothetical protein
MDFLKQLDEALELVEKKLAYKARKNLPSSDFALPQKRKYPIHDMKHARNALSRVSAHGSPAEKKTIKAKVRKRYPSIEVSEEVKVVEPEVFAVFGAYKSRGE